MKAIICAGGNGSRWGNYTGRRKHMALFRCVPLLQRTIDQLYARGVTDITVECHRDHSYEGQVEGVKQFITSINPDDVFVGRKALWKHFNNDGATLILLGDTYFSDASMDIVVNTGQVRANSAFHQIGRLSVSRATGKPGPEMFGWVLGAQRHHEFIEAIEVCQDAKAKNEHPLFNDWSIYQAMGGLSPHTHPSRLVDNGCHIELPDDGTDDFDFSDDYERFFHYMWHRSSRRVMVRDFHQGWFKNRMHGLNCAFKLHRKLWEHCSIAQAFVDRFVDSAVDPTERKALGFGVGKEPIPAFLANLGVKVAATDRPDPGVWLTRQHATSLLELRTEGICRPERLDNIAYWQVDMNDIPTHFHGQFDFTWSSSCFEHLGGIEAGLRFFCEQMKCLKPGGVAAHTTEWNTLDNKVTLDGKDLCVFRTHDFQRLAAMLEAQGDRLWPIDYQQGDTIEDSFVDSAPFRQEPHIQLALGGSVFTSVLLIAQRGRTK